MEDYQQLDIEIANCDAEIERNKNEREIFIAKRAEMLERNREVAIPALIAQIKALGLDASHFGLATPKKKATSTAAKTGPKKYRNPITGDEWSGRGNQPTWVKGQDKKLFLNPAWSATSDADLSATTTTLMVNPAGTNTVVELTAAPASNLPQLADAVDTPTNSVTGLSSTNPDSVPVIGLGAQAA